MEFEKSEYNIENFYKYLELNSLDTFEKIKTHFESDKYKLKIKEDNDFADLFNIINTIDSDTNQSIVRFCNGVIIDKNTLKIKSFTFNKCYEEDKIINNDFLEGEIYVEPCYEGTLIKVFNHDNNWITSTKKMINSKKSKWISSKSFYELFVETLYGYNLFEKLNPNYCYSFLLCNNENNTVIKYEKSFICHINTIDLINNKEIEEIIDPEFQYILKNQRVKIDNIDSSRQESLLNVISMYKNDNNINHEGYILINSNYTRQKFKKNNFVQLRNLWGNTNNRFFRYVQLRKNVNELNAYLNYFTQDKELFTSYEREIMNLTTEILNTYRKKFILKETFQTPFYFKKIIYNLHGDYLKSKEKIKFNDIMVKLLDLDDKNLCFIMNNYNKNKSEVLTSVDNQVQNTMELDP